MIIGTISKRYATNLQPDGGACITGLLSNVHRKGAAVMFGGIGIPELIIVLVIALIFFGPGKLPELGSSIGKAIKGFKKSMEEPEKKREGFSGDDRIDKR